MTSIIEEQLTGADNTKSEHGETLYHLSCDENFKKKTVLVDTEQAYAFGVFWAIAENYDLPILKEVLKEIADWNLSVDARGRNDIVDVSKFKAEKTLSLSERLLDMTGRR